MLTKIIHSKKIISSVILILLMAIFHIPLSHIVGSSFGFFSLNNMVTPLLGLVGGTWLLSIIMFSKILFFALKGSLLGSLLVNTLPGLCASSYWLLPSLVGHIIVPVICIAAFIIHPIGWAAKIYALYWLIPIVFYFIYNNNFFAKALTSTFIAHAVGSVIWLYCMHPMSATMWIALIPIVFVERIFFAMGMVLVYQLLSYMTLWIKNRLAIGKRIIARDAIC